MGSHLEPIPITSQKHDPAWQHCEMFKNGDRVQLKCVYCGKMFKGGGIHRIKEHLAGQKGNASTCLRVPHDVRLEMQQSLDGVVVRKRKKQKIAEQITNLNPVSSELVVYGDDQIDVDNGVEFIRVPNALEPSSSLLVNREEGESDGRGEKRKRGRSKGFVTSSNAIVAVNNNNDFLELGAKRVNDHVHMAIGRFLYDIGAPLDAVNSIYFQRMVDAIASGGSEVVIPSYHDLRCSILKNAVEEAKNDMAKQTVSWTSTGCSVLVDHLTTSTGRSLVHFHVDSPEGVSFLKFVDTSDIMDSADVLYELLKGVVEEIGIENILQVITNLEEQCVAAGKRLSGAFPTLYWAPCAACSLDLILEDFSKLDWINAVIEQARSITRFVYNHGMVLNMLRRYTFGNIVQLESTRSATDFATLKRMVDVKHALQSMVTSQEWMDCPYSKNLGGLEMLDLISNNSFWSSCDLIVRLTEPLLRVLRIVTLKKRPAMGSIYAGIYRVKEAIKKEFVNGDDYMVFWRIIEHRWDKQQNLPLHSAGFYLHPKFFYSIEGDLQNEIQSGLFDCIEKLVPDTKIQDKIIKEISSYKNASGDFGRKIAIRARGTQPPVEWWSTYGTSCPNLSRLAIRILSQTSSCVGYRKNQNSYEQIYGTRTMNHLECQRFNDLVFVQYNLRLKQMFSKKEEQDSVDPISIDNISIAEEWIMAKKSGHEDFANSDWTTLDPPASKAGLVGHAHDEVEDLGAGFDDYEIFNTLKGGEEAVERPSI